MKTTIQPYQLTPIPMIFKQKLPTYEFSNTIKKATKGLG
jgi:hypothetical protein